ncbi:O-linked N-acetylglucosamine transferase, SPINDLY family protein [Leptolyngbya sp. FACHB-321]|uniref:O-linked N-acetylglucosamine transferase, SPINDLY family protein n=1 Tax=Leptolyngbya sp. FACHB-321 TaxID=2692807 RepID=UPI001681D533|nr:O-linked N-acetylglucosamine transferase, SPINDLY family protein [Leptolyngbya sp. FACHB-321]MBD2037402.1 O-linked N-acetylglucosamine transferase, SPINDLY family protein [Leptolyngbya sp. FACHB-321]
MSATSNLSNPVTWQPKAYQWLLQADYRQASQFYEQAIEAEPEVKAHYWHLGLLLLLQGQEGEAQTTWLFGMSDGEPEQIEQWTTELLQVLLTEAERREAGQEYSVAWTIRQYIREIQPNNIANLLHLIQGAIALDNFNSDDLRDLDIMQQLQEQHISVDFDLLLQSLKNVLEALAPDPIILDFTEACLPNIEAVEQYQPLLVVLLPAALKIGFSEGFPLLAAHLLEQYLRLESDNVEVLGHLAPFYQNAGYYDKGIEVAKRLYGLTDSLVEKIFSNFLVLRGLMTAGGYWQESLETLERHKQLLTSLSAETLKDAKPAHVSRLFTSTYFLPYFKDDLRETRSIQNRASALCHDYIRNQHPDRVERYRQPQKLHHGSRSTDRLKIGYLSHCMGTHSVGWLARWLLRYHDRDRFQMHGYFINNRQNDPLHDWYVNQVEKACKLGVDCSNSISGLADQIYEDQIDILVDLDSLTLDLNSDLLALKPAPIQVTWLGWDASGLPSVDYCIADPYVLPDWAQDYYPEKIWRLPQTYIAVDGFEVAVPTLRRDDLNIPEDAVVYLSAQKGYKRHAETARLQMRILAQVPNSYFLIKGLADGDSIKRFFTEIAEAEGISSDRLRFLGGVESEAIHRANLTIADVVLDTFPYNGATTTLETLWMGIPLVTRVGEQFAARNSYTMMVNAGITEGIAWTDEEYVEWGVRLGSDTQLRQQAVWKLRQSRHTSPLWNAKQFTREMENAYEQMWKIHTQ